jgi:hypothetical protein
VTCVVLISARTVCIASDIHGFFQSLEDEYEDEISGSHDIGYEMTVLWNVAPCSVVEVD